MEAGSDGLAHKGPQQLIFENVSPATRLLEKRRQMYEVQDALENQKTRFAKEEEQFRKREEQLRAKDLQLQHQLFKFNKFLQDNEAKRRRAETRALEEGAQIRQREEEIRELEKQLEESKHLCTELEEEVARNMKYEEFLDRVKDTCEEYSEIQDLVTRYETLESAHKDLMENQIDYDKTIEELRREYQKYQKEQEMKLLELSNRLSSLQVEREDALKVSELLSHQMDEARQEDSKHSLNFGVILLSVDNLYLRCLSKRSAIQHFSAPKDEDDEKDADGEDGQQEGEDSFQLKQRNAKWQLRVILAYLKDFKDMTDTLKKEKKSEQSRTGRQHATVEVTNFPEPKFIVESDGPRSHNSGSQGNTREISQANVTKTVSDTTSGVRAEGVKE